MPNVTFGFQGGGISVTINADSTKAVPILRNNAELLGVVNAQTAPIASVTQHVLDEFVRTLVDNSRRLAKRKAVPPVEQEVDEDTSHEWDEAV